MSIESINLQTRLEHTTSLLQSIIAMTSVITGKPMESLVIILQALRERIEIGSFPPHKIKGPESSRISRKPKISYEAALKRIQVPINKTDFPKVVISMGLVRTSSTAEALAMSKNGKFIIFKQPIKSLRRGVVDSLNFDVGKDKTIFLDITLGIDPIDDFFDPVAMCLQLGFPPTHIAAYFRVREPVSNYASILRMDNTVSVQTFIDLKLKELELFLQLLFKDVSSPDNWIVAPVSVLSLDLLNHPDYSPEKVLSAVLSQFFIDRELGNGITGEFPSLTELEILSESGILHMLEGHPQTNPEYFAKIWKPILEKGNYGPFSDTDIGEFEQATEYFESFELVRQLTGVLHQEYTSLSIDNLKKMRM